ncbi:hypothetical protein BSKO_04828 [Bryopsis sp. KO-2023]|nr:hypothetical protein BSKO_04828 [Bryopsis sp. KO-2023]
MSGTNGVDLRGLEFKIIAGFALEKRANNTNSLWETWEEGFGQLRSFRAAPRSNSETPMQIAARLGHVAVIETDNPPTQLEESAKRSLAKRKRRNESWDAVEGEKIVTDEVLTSRPDILSEVEFTKDIEIKVGTQKMLLPVAAVQDVLKSKMREMVEEARAKHG